MKKLKYGSAINIIRVVCLLGLLTGLLYKQFWFTAESQAATPAATADGPYFATNLNEMGFAYNYDLNVDITAGNLVCENAYCSSAVSSQLINLNMTDACQLRLNLKILSTFLCPEGTQYAVTDAVILATVVGPFAPQKNSINVDMGGKSANVAFMGKLEIPGMPNNGKIVLPDFDPQIEKTTALALQPSAIGALQALIDEVGIQNVRFGFFLNKVPPIEGSWELQASFGTVPGSNLAATVTATATPGDCSVLNVTANVVNKDNKAQWITYAASLPSQLTAIANSCTASIGTCSIVDGKTITYSGMPGAGETVAINFKVKVAAGTPVGADLCIESTLTSTDGARCQTLETCLKYACSPDVPTPPTPNPPTPTQGGSVLIYNIYTSNPAAPIQQNTRINITNIDDSKFATVHLFFIDGSTCAVADYYMCLSPNQTSTFLASDMDPGMTGYIIAVATDSRTGCPINFNKLIGDEYIKFATGHSANLKAESFNAIATDAELCNPEETSAQIRFDGEMYEAAPRVLAVDNIPSRLDGNETMLIINRLGGDLSIGADSLGSLFGLFFNDEEVGYSFNLRPDACQYVFTVTNTTPRVVPRFEQIVPTGHTGWIKFWANDDMAIVGSMINFNRMADTAPTAFNNGHNLHKLRTTNSGVLLIPIFPARC